MCTPAPQPALPSDYPPARPPPRELFATITCAHAKTANSSLVSWGAGRGSVWTEGGVEQIGIRDLRNQSAAAVRRAGAGEWIVITVDGRPVAQLGPIEP